MVFCAVLWYVLVFFIVFIAMFDGLDGVFYSGFCWF